MLFLYNMLYRFFVITGTAFQKKIILQDLISSQYSNFSFVKSHNVMIPKSWRKDKKHLQ